MLEKSSGVDQLPLLTKISEMHHPPMLIHKQNNRILVRVACHGGDVFTINSIAVRESGKPAKIDVLSAMDLERYIAVGCMNI